MSKHYSPEADDQMPEKKTSQNRLLLLLLLLVALFGYLYFFTGLIKPREEQTAQAPAPAAAPTDVVKQPLPPRPDAGAQPKSGQPAADAKGDQAPGQPETAPAKPGAPAAPAAAPEGAKAGKPAAAAKGEPAGKPAAAPPESKPAKPAASQTARKPATPETKPAVKPAATAKAAPGKQTPPAADAKPSNGKPAPAKETKRAAAKEAKSAAAAKEAKTAAAAKPGEGANGAAKKGTAAVKGKAVAAKAAPATAAGAYALEINDELPAAEIKSVTAKLKQAGIAPVATVKSQKSEEVHRLYLADFGNRDEALEELERLKLAAPNAFMLKENGRYAVYAGSFMREGRAAVEQDRLFEKGVKLLLKTGTATVPVVKLRAGSYADQAKAEKAAQSLKQKGISAKVVKVAK